MEDAIVAMMKTHGVPLTRENYLTFNYLGKAPKQLDPEEEAALPARFRLPSPTLEEIVAEKDAKKKKEAESTK